MKYMSGGLKINGYYGDMDFEEAKSCLSDEAIEFASDLTSFEDIRNFVKGFFPESTISFSKRQVYTKVGRNDYEYQTRLDKIDIKLVNGSRDIALFIYYVLRVALNGCKEFDGLKVANPTFNATEKPVKVKSVTQETFVDALRSLGFDAVWASSTNNIYKYRKMSAVIVKEGGTYLVYDFNRGHGYIKLLSEKAKKASEVSSITDILGKPQIVFDEL